MRAMSTRNDEPERASRPFDIDRDGFVLGEGAGIMVLEREDFARARGATMYGRLAGIGMSADGYHITAPDPTGSGAARAIAAALRTAGLDPADIGHVNATPRPPRSATSPRRRRSAAAIGDHPVLTAPKSTMGHLLGAAGAVESIAAMLSVREGIIPPTLNLDHIDDGVQLDVAAGEARKVDADRGGERRVRVRRPQRRAGVRGAVAAAAATERTRRWVSLTYRNAAFAHRVLRATRRAGQPTWCSQVTGAPSPASRNGSSAASHAEPSSSCTRPAT